MVNFQDVLAKKGRSHPRGGASFSSQGTSSAPSRHGGPRHPAPLLRNGLSCETKLRGRKLPTLLHNPFLHRATSAATIHGFVSVSLAEKQSQGLTPASGALPALALPAPALPASPRAWTRASRDLANLLGHLGSHPWPPHSYLFKAFPVGLISCLCGFWVLFLFFLSS